MRTTRWITILLLLVSVLPCAAQTAEQAQAEARAALDAARAAMKSGPSEIALAALGALLPGLLKRKKTPGAPPPSA